MTNYERIMNEMTVEKLASYLVNTNVVDNGDYIYDGEDEYWVENCQEVYSSCANDYEYSNYGEAEQDLIDWLLMESVL